MDGLRNGPYRMCHAASGDVLGASAVAAGCIKQCEKKELDGQECVTQKGIVLSPDAAKGRRMTGVANR